MKLNYYKIESDCGYYNEFFTSLGQAMHRARKLCGRTEENTQALAEAVEIYKCKVCINKKSVLAMLDRGGWYGDLTKLGACTQFDGLEMFDKPRPCFKYENADYVAG